MSQWLGAMESLIMRLADTKIHLKNEILGYQI